MATSNRNNSSDRNSNSKATDRVVYSEFGSSATNPSAVNNADALERSIQELPPNQQNLRVQTSRKGRKGKTVTVITGFQVKPETLADLLKQLKAQCGAGGALKDNEIEIQGDQSQKLVQILSQMGYKVKVSGG